MDKTGNGFRFSNAIPLTIQQQLTDATFVIREYMLLNPLSMSLLESENFLTGDSYIHVSFSLLDDVKLKGLYFRDVVKLWCLCPCGCGVLYNDFPNF